MPKPHKAVHAAFIKANKVGDLAAAVQLARQTLATRLLTGAVDDEPGTLITLLRGERPPRQTPLDESVFDEHCADVFAALAMGVALGQLVHRDVFTKDGPR